MTPSDGNRTFVADRGHIHCKISVIVNVCYLAPDLRSFPLTADRHESRDDKSRQGHIQTFDNLAERCGEWEATISCELQPRGTRLEVSWVRNPVHGVRLERVRGTNT